MKPWEGREVRKGKESALGNQAPWAQEPPGTVPDCVASGPPTGALWRSGQRCQCTYNRAPIPPKAQGEGGCQERRHRRSRERSFQAVGPRVIGDAALMSLPLRGETSGRRPCGCVPGEPTGSGAPRAQPGAGSGGFRGNLLQGIYPRVR